MRIALTQREITFDNATNTWSLTLDALEREWYEFLAGHDIVPLPNVVDYDTTKWNFDCLIITGGPDSLSRHLSENNLYSWAVSNKIPVIGICHGAFVINDIEGGINGRIKGHDGEDHNIVMAGRVHSVNSFHTQYIQTLAPGFDPVAWDDDNNVEAFSHRSKHIHAVVWHPERQTVPLLTQPIKQLLGF